MADPSERIEPLGARRLASLLDTHPSAEIQGTQIKSSPMRAADPGRAPSKLGQIDADHHLRQSH